LADIRASLSVLDLGPARIAYLAQYLGELIERGLAEGPFSFT
jgi:hypothetical protein